MMVRTGVDFMADLYDVGTKKAVGYLPIVNIEKVGYDTVENVMWWAENNNKECKAIFSGHTYSGALYVYDYNMLNILLKKYSDILEDAGVPTEPHSYIEHIEHITVYSSEFPDAYKVIGLSFNDRRFK
jgi:hypothetical protein